MYTVRTPTLMPTKCLTIFLNIVTRSRATNFRPSYSNHWLVLTKIGYNTFHLIIRRQLVFEILMWPLTTIGLNVRSPSSCYVKPNIYATITEKLLRVKLYLWNTCTNASSEIMHREHACCCRRVLMLFLLSKMQPFLLYRRISIQSLCGNKN